MALVEDLVKGWQDNFTVRRVFGDPVERGDVTVIPVARIAGGGGGGGAPSEERERGRELGRRLRWDGPSSWRVRRGARTAWSGNRHSTSRPWVWPASRWPR